MGGARIRTLSLLGLVLMWSLSAHLAATPRLFPGPMAVAQVALVEFQTGGLLHHLAATMIRVLSSFVIAMTLGTAMGLAMGRSKLVDALFDGWLILFLNMPALVVIILA